MYVVLVYCLQQQQQNKNKTNKKGGGGGGVRLHKFKQKKSVQTLSPFTVSAKNVMLNDVYPGTIDWK